ncbi:MAG: hypothetical protein QOH17_477 [Pseudonocardiales bacterium]|jgi:hypothetical protein|nr:hypothetical protein [Pseudonocardiales bacterium]
MSDERGEQQPRELILEAMRAVLSDDHNYERGAACLTDLITRIAREDGGSTLADVAVAVSVALATALERIALDEGLAARDLIEVWFAE